MAADDEPTFTAEQVVSGAYHALLDRAPDDEGRQIYERRLLNGDSVTDVLRDFTKAPEFGLNHPAILAGHGSLPENSIELGLSDEQRERVWQYVRDTWSRLGREDPYFSVVTSEQFRLAKMSPEAVEHFYASGRADAHRLQRYLARNGRDLPRDAICIDYGCGLGRVTLWLARHYKQVIAVDVSEEHLGIAQRELAARGVNNVEFRLLRRRDDLAMLNGADLFHSVIVLQHNPPPIIADILQYALNGLNRGGVAFFQVPTYGFNYTWNYDRFIAHDLPASGMEMHALPQNLVFDLATRAGCVPIEVQPDGCAGMPYWVSNTFLFAKPGAARQAWASRLFARRGTAAVAADPGSAATAIGQHMTRRT